MEPMGFDWSKNPNKKQPKEMADNKNKKISYFKAESADNNQSNMGSPLPFGSASAPVFVPKGHGDLAAKPQVIPSKRSSSATGNSAAPPHPTSDDEVGSWTDDDIFLPKTFLPKLKRKSEFK